MRLCARRSDVQVVGEATCGKTAIDAADRLNPDILLSDVQLPDMSGFELLRAVGADTHRYGDHGLAPRRSCHQGLRRGRTRLLRDASDYSAL